MINGQHSEIILIRAFEISWFCDYLFWHLSFDIHLEFELWHLSFESILFTYLDPIRVDIKPLH
jgi:hypothetical protein